MGGHSSKSNDELVDSLVNNHSIKDKQIEHVFRLVDRGRFFPPEYVTEAYREAPFKIPDSAADDWQPGLLHISAPGMYASVLEKLELRPGHSFLNIGSGTGWLNTAVGFLIGSEGVNHGIEIHENLVKYSLERRHETLNCAELAPFSFAVPLFVHGNGLCQKVPDGLPRYHRIYCGAAVTTEKQIDRLVRLLELQGRLIAPVNGQLMCYRRTGPKRYLAQRLLSCSFADLIRPTKKDNQFCLPKIEKPDFLQRLCRDFIRQTIRDDIWATDPPKMRSQTCKDGERVNHPIYLTGAGDQHGVAQANHGAWGDFAHVRYDVPANAERRMLGLEEDEDNTRVQVYDLKDEEEESDDENQQIVPPVADARRLQLRRPRLAEVDELDEQDLDLLLDVLPNQMDMDQLRRMNVRNLNMFVAMRRRNQAQGLALAVHLDEPFADEGPPPLDAAEGNEENRDPRVEEPEEEEAEAPQEEEQDAGSSSSDEYVAVNAPPEDNAAVAAAAAAELPAVDSDAEVEEIMRPRNPMPPELPEVVDEALAMAMLREGHRRVSRQRMQVMRMRRRRHMQANQSDSSDEDRDEEEPAIVIAHHRRQMSEQNKRRRTEMEQLQETKDDRQIRLQRESIEKFREVFNRRINGLPIPHHMLAYLKHANGFI